MGCGGVVVVTMRGRAQLGAWLRGYRGICPFVAYGPLGVRGISKQAVYHGHGCSPQKRALEHDEARSKSESERRSRVLGSFSFKYFKNFES